MFDSCACRNGYTGKSAMKILSQIMNAGINEARITGASELNPHGSDIALSDSYGRAINYVRLSVTDLCNFKCDYCLPDGYKKTPSRIEPLGLDEYEVLLKVLADLGVQKIRVTGGEPVLRKDLTRILQCVQRNNIAQLHLSTNGYQLARNLPIWQHCGVKGINISIDRFDESAFAKITGHSLLPQIISAIDESLRRYAFTLKVNMVLMSQFALVQLEEALDFVRDRNIDLRFIELMQTQNNVSVFASDHVKANDLIKKIESDGWTAAGRTHATAGPANMYEHRDFAGRIGFIKPYSPGFCDSCNRIRISSNGEIHSCLFATKNSDIRSFMHPHLHEKLKESIQKAIAYKPAAHALSEGQPGLMRELAQLGG